MRRLQLKKSWKNLGTGFPVLDYMHHADQPHDIADDCTDQDEGPESCMPTLVDFLQRLAYAECRASCSCTAVQQEDEEREFRLLRSYLVFNEIPHRLGQKVTRFLQHQFSLKQQAKSADLHVPLLDLLSHQLQARQV